MILVASVWCAQTRIDSNPVLATPANKQLLIARLTVGLTTATNVNPPFVANRHCCIPASMNLLRVKLTCPFKLGPPEGLYVGSKVLSGLATAALVRLFADTNDVVSSLTAINLTQAVVEGAAITGCALPVMDL
jgi:hypothetical protein